MKHGARRDIVSAFVQAVRTGEPSATRKATAALANGAVLESKGTTISDRAQIVDRFSGQWVLTSVYEKGQWSEPEETGSDMVRVAATFPGIGAAPKSYALTFTFNAQDQVTRIQEEAIAWPAPAALKEFPDNVRSIVNRALANATPMVIGHVSDDGAPVLTLRGSVQVYDGKTLSLWVRNAKSGLCAAIAAGRPVSLLYRNSANRTTLIFTGKGEVATDEAVRTRVFDGTPEVEQRHDTGRSGAAVLVHVTRLQGTTPDGPVLVTP